jgi:hypothetical protein
MEQWTGHPKNFRFYFLSTVERNLSCFHLYKSSLRCVSDSEEAQVEHGTNWGLIKRFLSSPD